MHYDLSNSVNKNDLKFNFYHFYHFLLIIFIFNIFIYINPLIIIFKKNQNLHFMFNMANIYDIFNLTFPFLLYQ